MKASAILSALLTVGVLAYLLLTEWTFWKKWIGPDAKKPASTSRARQTARTGQDAGDKGTPVSQHRGQGQSSSSSGERMQAAPGTKEPEPDQAAVVARTGTTVYKIDLPCDCVLAPSLVLETVEINDTSTILTFLNAARRTISTYPPGHADAQFILEWRYEGNHRPRHNLTGARGIELYPEESAPLSFQLVFPRIADAARKFQLSGHLTKHLDYFQFASVPLEQQMPEDEWKRFESFKQCGFDGGTSLGMNGQTSYAAHKHPGQSGHRWSATGGLEIVSGERERVVKVRGKGRGEAELCLSSEINGKTCRSCREIEVMDALAAPAPDFRMDTCGGVPTRKPHWQFSVDRPEQGATYRWTVTHPTKMLEGTEQKTMVDARPSARPGFFTVTLEATYASGKRASYAKEFHNAYSCPVPGSL